MKKKSYQLLLSFGYIKEDAQEVVNSLFLHKLKDESLCKNILNVYNYLRDYYTKEEIVKMTKFLPALYGYSINNINGKINDLVDIGYTKKDVIEMTKKQPSLYGYSMINIKKKIEDMILLGYTKEDVIKMTKLLPALYAISIKNIKQKIEDMMHLGYTKEDVIKMTKLLPSLYAVSIENMKKKIEDMMYFGYTKEDVIKLTKLLPALYGLDIENIRQKIDNIEKLGYERKDVIEMTKKLPALFSYSIDNIKRKINFYKSINLENIVLEDTKQLMQSVELSYARYRYLTIKKAEITKDNYSKLFYSQNNFKKRLGIDNKTVKKLYPFEGYLKVQKLYKKLEILSKSNPEASKGILNNSIKKYVDANCSIEKRINNKYDKILKNSKV